MLNKNIFNNLKEGYLFYSILLLNLIILCSVKYYPSMDGPAHLHNAKLLSHLIQGDFNSFSEFYEINSIAIPNWTSHIVLGSLITVFPAWLAEKIMLCLYIIGLTLSFRLLITKLNPTNNYLSFIIFPFTYSFLFHLGFYNYSISFIFLFFTLYYWLKIKDTQTNLNSVVLSLLLILTYFSGVLTYFFLGLTLGLFVISIEIGHYFQNRQLGFQIYTLFKKLGLLLLISLPSLLLLMMFLKSISYAPSGGGYPMNELTKWIDDVRALIVYDYVGEEKLTSQFLHIIIAIFSISLFLRFKNIPFKKFAERIDRNDIILVPVLVALVLFYIVPNDSSARMMSDRYILMFYMLLIIWVAWQPLPKRVSQILVFLILVLHFGLLMKHQNGTIRKLNRDAISIETVAKYIETGSVILPINMSDNWLEGHFSNYLGVNKPLVILENYEAGVGWFPLKWNWEKIPNIMLGKKTSVSGIQWPGNTNSAKIKQIDYVFLYGALSKVNDAQWIELKEELNADFTLVYTTDNQFAALYKKTSP
jgi:hypothetical protein